MLHRVPDEIHDHPISSFIFIIIMVLYSILIIKAAYDEQKEANSLGAIFILRIITVVLSCFTVFSVGMCLKMADSVADISPELLDVGFYLEIIMLAVFYGALYILILLTQKPLARSDDESDRMTDEVKTICKAIMVIIFSSVFLFTDMEITLQSFGFRLFGKTLGQWVLNSYFAWVSTFIFNFIALACQIPFIYIFGNPLRFLDD